MEEKAMMKKKTTLKGKMVTCLAAVMTMAMMLTVNVSAAQNRSSNFNKSYKLTGSQAQDVMAVAKAQVGKTKSQLKYTEAWCANFVLDCARLANVPSTVIPYNYASGSSCRSLYNYMLSNCKAKVTTSPQAGDLVFYYCEKCKAYAHVGYYDSNGYTIEGNMYVNNTSKVMRYNTAYCDGSGHSTKNAIKKIYVRPNYQKTVSSTVSYTAPKKVTGLNLKTSRKKLIVSYSKAAGASGYQIQYRKKGTSSWTTVTCTATSKTLSLKAFTNYQVRVRAYVKAGSVYKYGAWSNIATKMTFI